MYFGDDNPELIAFEELETTYTKNDNVLFIVAPRSEQVDAGALWDDAGHAAGGPRRSAGTLLGTVRLTGESGKNRVCRNFQDQTGAVLLPQLRSLRCTFVVSLYCPEGFNSSSHCFGGILMMSEAVFEY